MFFGVIVRLVRLHVWGGLSRRVCWTFLLLGDSVTPGKPSLQDSGRRCSLLNGKRAGLA